MWTVTLLIGQNFQQKQKCLPVCLRYLKQQLSQSHTGGPHCLFRERGKGKKCVKFTWRVATLEHKSKPTLNGVQ